MHNQQKNGTSLPLTLAASALLLGASHASAQDAEVAVLDTSESRLSATVGGDFTSAYFFRGYLQEDEGLIFQPYAELGMALLLPDNDDSIGLSASLGTWNSFHSEQTGATGGGAESWYESDIYATLTLAWKRLELSAGYTFYMYPNSTFNTVQEAFVSVGFDTPDDTIFGKIIGDPSLTLSFETDNSNVSSSEASYAQIDFGPSFEVFGGKATVSVPVSIGLSIDDYYVGTDDEAFGFASVAVNAEVPLHSGEWGEVVLNFGGTLLLLGDTTKAANSGDEVDGFFYAGVSVAF